MGEVVPAKLSMSAEGALGFTIHWASVANADSRSNRQYVMNEFKCVRYRE